MLFNVFLFLSGASFAKVPSFYSSLESLRQQTVAVRVAIDFSDSKEILSCPSKILNAASLGANLQLKTDSAKTGWKNILLNKDDVILLKTKIANCENRGSCSVYLDFLQTVTASNELTKEIEVLKESLTAQLAKLPAKSYLKAWGTIKKGCRKLE